MNDKNATERKRNPKANNASDIRISYNVSKFKKIDESLTKDKITTPEKLLLIALYGFNRNLKVPVEEKNSEEEHTFSRVVYQGNQVEMMSNFGLVTILDNLQEDYTKVINTLAFATTGQQDLPFTKLPNVSTFYSYLLGGIDPLYHDLFGLGSSTVDVATSLYDIVSNVKIDDDMLESLILEDEFI